MSASLSLNELVRRTRMIEEKTRKKAARRALYSNRWDLVPADVFFRYVAPRLDLISLVRFIRCCKRLTRRYELSEDWWRSVFTSERIRPMPQHRVSSWEAQVAQNYSVARKLLGTDARPALSASQVEALERKYCMGHRLPPDLRFLLSLGVPAGFHDYAELVSEEQDGQEAEEDSIQMQRRWHAQCGDAEERAENPLLPLSKHMMMVVVPCQEGNPVFSMHQSYDNIVDGTNLWDWFAHRRKLKGVVPPSWIRPPDQLKTTWWQPFIQIFS